MNEAFIKIDLHGIELIEMQIIVIVGIGDAGDVTLKEIHDGRATRTAIALEHVVIPFEEDAFRRLYSKPTTHFREFLESKVEENPEKYGIAACIILNNSLDFVRSNAKASIVMKTGEEFEGIVKKIQDDGSFDVYIDTTNKTKNVLPHDCSSIWCTPAKNVDLSKATTLVCTLFIDARIQAIMEEYIIDSPIEPLWSISRMIFLQKRPNK